MSMEMNWDGVKAVGAKVALLPFPLVVWVEDLDPSRTDVDSMETLKGV